METFVVERKKLFEQVASHLERQILGGLLKPGDRLPPGRDLQAIFGVGRPAIREALISLQKAGLIDIGNGAPARVAQPTAEGVLAGIWPAVQHMLGSEEGQRHFQDARLFFEVGLARRAALDATDENVACLRRALDNNREALGDMERFIDTDVAFHFVLAKITGNPVFLALHDAMSGWLRYQRVKTLARVNQDRTAFDAHVAICEAVAARDADGAEAAMRAHILQLSATFWDAGSAA